MEFVNSTISLNPHISPAIPFLTWKNPSRLYLPTSRKFPLRPSFSLYPCQSVPSKKFRVSARLGRPSNRQNYLRKKLTQQQQQQVSLIQHPVHEFDKFDVSKSNFDSSSGRIEEDLDSESKFGSFSEGILNPERSSQGDCFNASESVNQSESELSKKKIGESVMWNELDNWAEQYKKDSEFWGIGTSPIFTVIQNSEGKVERVVVNEDEIMKRSRVDPRLANETEDLAEVNFKISFGNDLAREMENGSDVIPKYSSVAKFSQSGKEWHFMEVIRGVTLKPGLFPRMSRVGFFVLCGLCVIWAIRGLFAVGENGKKYTRLEKKMLQRKIKARTEKEKMVKGSVEVMQVPLEPEIVPFKRPQLDKEELVNRIIKATGSNSEPGIVEYTGYQNKEYTNKIEEVRTMARHAREVERRDSLPDGCNKEDPPALKDLYSHSVSPENDLRSQKEVYDRDSDETTVSKSFNDEDIDEKSERKFFDIPNVTESLSREARNIKPIPEPSDSNEANRLSEGPGCQSGPHESSSRKKVRIIKSAKEARDYLSAKHHKLEVVQKHDEVSVHLASGKTSQTVDLTSKVNDSPPLSEVHDFAHLASGKTSQIVDLTSKVNDSPPLSEVHDFAHLSEDYTLTSEENMDRLDDLKKSRIASGDKVSVNNKNAGISVSEVPRRKENDMIISQNSNSKNVVSSIQGGMPDSTFTEDDRGGPVQNKVAKHNSEDAKNNEMLDKNKTANEVKDKTADLAPSVNKESWLEKNFHEFEPIIEKIAVGFRDNYWVARERASQEMDSETELTQLKSEGGDSELEWMKDEKLRDIVFKVRDNELSGRDPFHLMDEEDKSAFFSGLEKKVQLENEKLLSLHEYFHSNIENLDYGAAGISIYDPPEKIIPRWKVPPAEANPAETNPEFLNNFVEQRKALFAEGHKNSFPSKKTEKDIVNKSEEPSKDLPKDNLASSKTVIQGSDGSVRAGKKSGKEFWQHTKKWSEGFLECYNSETDPEVKAMMRNMGKDLDRWITEKEIEEAAELMDQIPKKGHKFIKEKLEKVKRQVQHFGPQAVVSKYREYAEEKEEDYLWWLDLRSVLCIEMYTVDNNEERVGFYSLEMGADLELDPKQYHVIAFEDAGDCKNLCYIIQAHMEMLGIGNAFVVARPPKDAFREAKANGFSITVIRKGQLQLNIDQTLEEVEESIVEIGSKIYQDKIVKEHSININGLMKGLFGVSKRPRRRRSKQKLRRRIKP